MNDKLKHKAEELTGKAKSAAGDASGDERLKSEGEKDRSKANVKQAGDKMKDAFTK